MIFEGRLEYIHITHEAGADMCALKDASLISGMGIEGDRYFMKTGKFSAREKDKGDRQITLIEIETLEALARDHGIALEPWETRRNLTVRDVPLNHLVDRSFRIGEAVLKGVRLNRPCTYLDGLVGKDVSRLMIHRSGLNCAIIESGTIRLGDKIVPA